LKETQKTGAQRGISNPEISPETNPFPIAKPKSGPELEEIFNLV
jgi:hypothetical protein